MPKSELADKVINALKTRYNGRSSIEQSASEAAHHSMELLRLNIQHLFNNEVHRIVQKYIDVIH